VTTAARDLPIIALIAAYNEGDVIGSVVSHLIDEGISVYLLDHESTDDTVERAREYLGRGLLDIERFSSEKADDGAPGRFVWQEILRRKEALAADLDGAWFIHHDADEFRESPWAHLNLRDAIWSVDALGYNAIDFELLNFWPTHDDFRPATDVRQTFHYYSPGELLDKIQIKCWKKTAERVDLVSSGGHEAIFPGRRVFPLRFVLRHYPIRGQAHGERKVFRERLPRFMESERARGWHVQYDSIRPDERFIRDPATMIPYDPDRVRLQLMLRHRDVEALEAAFAAERQQIQAQLAAERDSLIGQLQSQSRQLESQGQQLESQRLQLESLGRQLEAIASSRSWRWTAPMRAVFRLASRRRA
jgi:hypothetical protein